MAYDSTIPTFARVWDKEKKEMITIQILIQLNLEDLKATYAQKAYNNKQTHRAITGNGSIAITHIPSTIIRNKGSKTK